MLGDILMQFYAGLSLLEVTLDTGRMYKLCVLDSKGYYDRYFHIAPKIFDRGLFFTCFPRYYDRGDLGDPLKGFKSRRWDLS